MASKLTAADIPRIGINTDMDSPPVDDAIQALKDKINELVDEISAVSIGTTNAETTDARPYHTNLKNRLDSIGSGQYHYIKEGGVVSINGVDPQKVDITAGEAKINGIDVKWSAATSGTISYCAAGETRFDVVYAKSDSAIEIQTGTADANDWVLPTVDPATKKALWVLTVTDAAVSLSWDARNQGCYYLHDGAFKYKWFIQDAIDDISQGTILIGHGRYYEYVDLSGKDNITLYGSNGAALYRIDDASECISCVNSGGSEGNFIHIIGLAFYGNGKAGAIRNVQIEYTDKSSLKNCYFDGNASSSATKKDLLVDYCDFFYLLDNYWTNGDVTYNLTNSTEYLSDDTSDKKVDNSYKIYWGTDVTLTRGGADELKTDDSFEIGANGGKTTLQLSDTTANVGMTIGGDVNLYRSGANVLKTDDEFQASSISVAAGNILASTFNSNSLPGAKIAFDHWQTASTQTEDDVYEHYIAVLGAYTYIASGIVTDTSNNLYIVRGIAVGLSVLIYTNSAADGTATTFTCVDDDATNTFNKVYIIV